MPTAVPTSTPTVAPSQPGDTNVPTAVPTSSPTATPTIEEFSFPIDTEYSFYYNYSVTNSSATYADLTMTGGGANNNWATFVDTFLTSELELSYHLEVWSIKEFVSGEKVFVHALCDSEKNATLLASAMSAGSDVFVECGRHSWAVIQGTLCVDCSGAEIAALQAGQTSCAALDGSVRDFVNPLPSASGGEVENCLSSNQIDTIDTLIGFNVFQLVPATVPQIVGVSIAAGGVTASSFVVTVDMGSSPSGGGVYITATSADGSAVLEVFSPVGAAGESLLVVVDGLTALTEYAVSARAEDTLGNVGKPTDDQLVTTACCHHVTLLTPLPRVVFANLSDYDKVPHESKQHYLVHFELNHVPSIDLRVSLAATFPGLVTIPAFYNFTADSSVLTGAFLLTGEKNTGSIFLKISGGSVDDFSVVNVTDSMISVVSISDPCPPRTSLLPRPTWTLWG
jgi:hypothetical protein